MLFVCFALYLLPARIVIVAELQRRRASRRPPAPKIARFGAALRCFPQYVEIDAGHTPSPTAKPSRQ